MHALKDGSAKSTIEGLSQSGKHYMEAIECLKSQYNRPRQIHWTHVQLITSQRGQRQGTMSPSWCYHSTSLYLDIDGVWPIRTFITSQVGHHHPIRVAETHPLPDRSATLPEITDIHWFAEGSATAVIKRVKSEPMPSKKTPTTGRSVSSFVSNHDTVSSQCILCQNEKHPVCMP